MSKNNALKVLFIMFAAIAFMISGAACNDKKDDIDDIKLEDLDEKYKTPKETKEKEIPDYLLGTYRLISLSGDMAGNIDELPEDDPLFLKLSSDHKCILYNFEDDGREFIDAEGTWFWKKSGDMSFGFKNGSTLYGTYENDKIIITRGQVPDSKMLNGSKAAYGEMIFEKS